MTCWREINKDPSYQCNYRAHQCLSIVVAMTTFGNTSSEMKRSCIEPKNKTKNKNDDDKKKPFFSDDYTVYRITFKVRLSHTMLRFLGDNEPLVACTSSPVDPDDFPRNRSLGNPQCTWLDSFFFLLYFILFSCFF